jgi:hypothetical protein
MTLQMDFNLGLRSVTVNYRTLIESKVDICRYLNGSDPNPLTKWLVDLIWQQMPRSLLHPCPYFVRIFSDIHIWSKKFLNRVHFLYKTSLLIRNTQSLRFQMDTIALHWGSGMSLTITFWQSYQHLKSRRRIWKSFNIAVDFGGWVLKAMFNCNFWWGKTNKLRCIEGFQEDIPCSYSKRVGVSVTDLMWLFRTSLTCNFNI